MKTTLRYLLIVAGLVSVLSICAQTLAQQPEVKMQSTSVMMTSGSTLPQAAVTGVNVAGSTPAAYTPGKPGMRRAADKDDDDTPPADPHGPMEDPIGDAGWPLALCACAYLIWRATRKRVKPLNG